jgi:hypothetical protein
LSPVRGGTLFVKPEICNVKPYILSSSLMKERSYLKEPVALLWIVIGLVASVAVMVGIERLVPRY